MGQPLQLPRWKNQEFLVVLYRQGFLVLPPLQVHLSYLADPAGQTYRDLLSVRLSQTALRQTSIS